MTLAFLSGQVQYMRDRGYTVYVVSAPGEDLVRFAARYGATPHAVPMTRRITPFRDLLAVLALARLLRRLRPTIVHAHTPKGGLVGMLAGWLARAPVRVYHLRGLAWRPEDAMRSRLLRITERVSCGLAHRVFAVSRSLREAAIGQRLCEADRILVLEGGSGNGVDAEHRFHPRLREEKGVATRRRLGIDPDAPVIGFVGRLARDKGIVELAAAWRELRQAFPDAHLLLVGPIEENDPLPFDVLGVLEADARVHTTGLDWDTPPLYAAMDVVALPTYREGFPNVPLEAAAMELPVVATRIPGCEEAVKEGVTGTLVPVGDPAALAEALAAYLADPEKRRRHGAAGRARVLAEFRPQAIWQSLHEEYERLVAARVEGTP
jgi:glycosyltransferase involved in cell wall biosynthesis